ncbi:PdaC/SigV domain-containing protein [Stenotrophomonas humi]
MNRFAQGSFAAATLLLVLAGCKKDGQQDGVTTAPAPEQAATSTETASGPAPINLSDVIEHTPSYMVGISYPPAAAKYPGLAQELTGYAEHARAELLKAASELGNDKPTAPYELSLSFDMLMDTPRVVAVSADGSSYTGGAHGQPLVARFVWLPEQQKLLKAEDLINTPKGWQALSDYVEDKLLEQATVRAQGEDLSPEEQQEQVRTLSRMIDEGTAPEPSNFSQFQPVLDDAGHISALRFVFPPYQVGPYSDGTQTVDVPAAVLLPNVAADYRELFSRN